MRVSGSRKETAESAGAFITRRAPTLRRPLVAGLSFHGCTSSLPLDWGFLTRLLPITFRVRARNHNTRSAGKKYSVPFTSTHPSSAILCPALSQALTHRYVPPQPPCTASASRRARLLPPPPAAPFPGLEAAEGARVLPGRRRRARTRLLAAVLADASPAPVRFLWLTSLVLHPHWPARGPPHL